MKNIILPAAIAVLFGAGLMSCSMVEGAMGENADVSSLGGFLDTLWALLKGFLPSLAAWEGGCSIFSPRKRQHYTNMVMAVVPLNKNMEFGDAVKSLGSGLGISHSSEATKATNTDEVASKKVEAAKPAKKV
tara:strand:- start:22186 stop:22581 length:396 start_codon:yes stop_codon:yes gene_type:complete